MKMPCLAFLLLAATLFGGQAAQAQDDPKNTLLYAERFLRMGKPEAAIVFYTRVIAAAPNTPEAAEAYNDRGVAHARLEHSDQAMADYDRAVESGYPLAWFNRAKARLRLLAERPDPALKDQVRADLTAFAAYLGQDGPKPPVVEHHREALEAELAEAWKTLSAAD